uniref:PD-(D/E)XK nuclease superfamily protein n=1 Tax=viral metagenome TaxID=1070528 RepID=A0A6M3IRF3_9ZZZZ
MKIRRNTILRDTILDGFVAQNLPDRKIDEPWHVSDLIYCLRKSFWGRTDPLPPTPRQAMLFMTGKGLANELTGGEPEEEYTLDGIVGHPDYVKLYPPWEVKTTRKKVDDNPQTILEMRTWMEQIMCYMRMLKVTQFTLVEMGLMGDYKPPFPSLEVWELEETWDVIEANWQEMLRRRDVLEDAMKGLGLPPMSTLLDKKGGRWECRECAYLLRCSWIL